MKTCLLAADRWQLLITAVVALLFTLKGGAVKCEFLAKKKKKSELKIISRSTIVL